jgi:hypothetical protein
MPLEHAEGRLNDAVGVSRLMGWTSADLCSPMENQNLNYYVFFQVIVPLYYKKMKQLGNTEILMIGFNSYVRLNNPAHLISVLWLTLIGKKTSQFTAICKDSRMLHES